MKNLIRISVFLIPLLIPSVAMQLTDEIKWGAMDFLVAAVLLLSAGFAITFIASKIENRTRLVAGISVIAIFFVLVWAELAVGIFGTPFAGS